MQAGSLEGATSLFLTRGNQFRKRVIAAHAIHSRYRLAESLAVDVNAIDLGHCYVSERRGPSHRVRSAFCLQEGMSDDSGPDEILCGTEDWPPDRMRLLHPCKGLCLAAVVLTS